MRNEKFDLTNGGIIGKLLLVSLPIMGTQLLQMCYNLTDMFFLGLVGSNAVAASGSAGMYLWLANGLMLVGRMGAQIGVAQALGGRHENRAREYAQNALLLSLTIGFLYFLAAFFLNGRMAAFFQMTDARVEAATARYIFLTSPGVFSLFLSASVAGTFNGSGNSRIPFLLNLLGFAMNVVLDPIFIFVMGWGLSGAAVATTISQISVCALSLFAIKRQGTSPFPLFRFFFRPSLPLIQRILKWSAPVAMESILFTLLTMPIARKVASFGPQATAVYRVGSQVESLSWLIGFGFSAALTSFVGQNFGAEKWDRIHKGFRSTLAAVCLWGIFITVLFLTSGRLLVSAFLHEPELIEMGNSFLRIFAFCQIVGCLEFSSSGALRGIGQTFPPSVVSVVVNAFRVPLVYYLAATDFGLDGVWIGMTSGAVLRGSLIFVCLLLQVKKMPKPVY